MEVSLIDVGFNPTINNSLTILHVKRSTPALADELAARARFTAVSQAVRLRAKDLMQINADQAAFLAQRDTANGKKTMKSYLWMLEGAKYDSEHGQG